MLILSIVASTIFVGCGSSDSPAVISTQTGTFVDSAVAGLNYTCASDSSTGVTNIAGEFTCLTGSNVEFRVGNYVLGSCTIEAIVTPYSLYPNDSAAAVNVAQLLQTIDSDNDPLNGISVPDSFSALDAVTTAPTDTLFDTDISAVAGVLVTEQEAEGHLHTTLDLPTVTDGFTTEWMEGQTLYLVILDTQDDDNDGSTTDWMLNAEKYENGQMLVDFSADGAFEETGVPYEIIDGVFKFTEPDGDWETATITAVDTTKITINRSVSWNALDSTEYLFYTKAALEEYISANLPSVENGFTQDYLNGRTLYRVILEDGGNPIWHTPFDFSDNNKVDFADKVVNSETYDQTITGYYGGEGIFVVRDGKLLEYVHDYGMPYDGINIYTVESVDSDKIVTSMLPGLSSLDTPYETYFYFNHPLANGFTEDWIEGKILYDVILDEDDDDNDGSTTDLLLIAVKFENGILLVDLFNNGVFESTDETYEIIDGALKNNYSDGEWETAAITALNNTKITVTWSNSWGDPDETGYYFYTASDAQAYMDTL